MTLSSVCVIIILGYTNVFFLPFDRKLEYFNEASILICINHLFLFTDFVSDPQTRYFIGYSMIASILLNFIVNAFLVLQDTIMKFVKLYK